MTAHFPTFGETVFLALVILIKGVNRGIGEEELKSRAGRVNFRPLARNMVAGPSWRKKLYKSALVGVYPVSNVIEQSLNWRRSLYEEKAAELILYGRALGLSHSEAEDVLQETFLALMKMEEAPLEPLYYCLRSLRNRAVNYHRSLWRRVARELESSRWFERSEGESHRERAAMRCLAKLPAEQREVIVLKIWHQSTFESIGRLLELSPNTVAGRYRYGLQKLRACLKDESYENDETAGGPITLLESTQAFPDA